MRPIGLQLYTLRKPFAADPLGTLTRIRETGYDSVEFAAPLGADFAGFAARMREIGLDCPSAHVGLADMAERPDAVMEMAGTLGCRYLVMPYLLPDQRDWPAVITALGVFARRARHSSVWRVPEVYRATARVIEMEYVEGAVNIARAVQHFRPADPLAYRRDLADKFLFTLLCQFFLYQELHGDLHPGNVMVDRAGRLHLIDWGNTVPLAGKVRPVVEYLKGALVADADLLTDALIAISTDPAAAQARRAEIRDTLARTLDKKQITPLTLGFAWTLYREGPEGWLKRANTLMQLASNTQQLGLVLRGEYLHLSRSLTAMVATLGGLYEGVPRWRAGADLLITVNTFPARALKDWLRGVRADRLRAAAEPVGRAPSRTVVGGLVG